MGWSCRTHKSHHKCVQLWTEKFGRKKSCGKIRILRKACMTKWSDFIWLRIKIVRRVLLTWQQNFGFCKRRKISCLSEMWFGKVRRLNLLINFFLYFSPSLLSNTGIVLPFKPLPFPYGDRGSTVVKVLCYNSEGRWFDLSWCHWNFSLT